MTQPYKSRSSIALEDLSTAIATEISSADGDTTLSLKNLFKIIRTNSLIWEHENLRYELCVKDDVQYLKLEVLTPVSGDGTSSDPITVSEA